MGARTGEVLCGHRTTMLHSVLWPSHQLLYILAAGSGTIADGCKPCIRIASVRQYIELVLPRGHHHLCRVPPELNALGTGRTAGPR